MTVGTTKHPDCGRRVEIPPHADMWMRGARFGVIERVIDGGAKKFIEPRGDVWRVRLDHPKARGKLYGFWAVDCTLV